MFHQPCANIFSKWNTNEIHKLPKFHRPRPFTKKVQKQDTKPRLMHPEPTPKPELRIDGIPTSKGAHTKKSVSTYKGVQEQQISTRT